MTVVSTLQTIKNKASEINFRKKLVEQHLGKKTYFTGQPDQALLIKELKKRLSATKKDFKYLRRKKIELSPFLEIGAEKCQRSLFLLNDLNLAGFASDISFESLYSANHFAGVFNYKKMPVRVCLDAYNLPFKDNCLPFVFLYETLHHFPDPKPILDEAYRVLRSDGYLFFAEEPVKQLINLRLFRRDFRLSRLEKLLKMIFILPFISTIGKSEINYGILEEAFFLKTWEKSLSKFKDVEVTLRPYPVGSSHKIVKTSDRNHWLKPNFLTTLLLSIQGGGIMGLAKVTKSKNKDFYSNNILDLLACPNCPVKSGLKPLKSKKVFLCPKCKSEFVNQNGVLLLLSTNQLKKLYPNFKQS